MGSISDLIGALALLGITRVWDAREEDRRSRQEETFVPFRLPPLMKREQLVSHPEAETRPSITVTTSAFHARPTQ